MRAGGTSISDTAQIRPYAVHASVPPCAGPHDVDPKSLRQSFVIDRTATSIQLISHVQNEKRRQSHLEDRLDQHQLVLESCHINDENERVRRADALDLALEDVTSHPLVECPRREAVHTGEVNEGHLTPVTQIDLTDVLLDGDTRVVRDLLSQPGKLIEQRGLTGVRRTYERYERRLGR